MIKQLVLPQLASALSKEAGKEIGGFYVEVDKDNNVTVFVKVVGSEVFAPLPTSGGNEYSEQLRHEADKLDLGIIHFICIFYNHPKSEDGVFAYYENPNTGQKSRVEISFT